jgi:hypothetical protein
MDTPVECVCHDNVIHIIHPSGGTAIYEQSQRSKLLEHMAGASGAFSLPVTYHGVNLLSEANTSIENGLEWSGRRLSDLGLVAEVCDAHRVCPNVQINHHTNAAVV